MQGNFHATLRGVKTQPPRIDDGGVAGGGVQSGGFDFFQDLPLSTNIMHVNIQGLRSHLAELCAVVRLSSAPPDIICINETFLDDGVKNIEVEGYEIIGRRDRSFNGDERKCGGIIVFARSNIASNVTLIETSAVSERMWFQMHSNNGPYLLCCW